jgi:hypothetical protein
VPSMRVSYHLVRVTHRAHVGWEQDKEPKASIVIKNAKLNKQVECRPFKHCFSLTTSTLEMLVSAQGHEEWSAWTSALEAAASQPPSLPPIKVSLSLASCAWAHASWRSSS